MGRSLRRIKKAKPTVIKRKNKKRHARTQVPTEVTTQKPDIKRKLGIDPTWDQDALIDANYEKIGFAADVNVATGRNAPRGDALGAKAAALAAAQEEPEIDEDLKVAMALQRASGKAPPKRPTPRQRSIVARLVAAHGGDLDAMARDRKLNAMQHTKAQLQALIHSCQHWEGKSGVDFRVPNKRLW